MVIPKLLLIGNGKVIALPFAITDLDTIGIGLTYRDMELSISLSFDFRY